MAPVKLTYFDGRGRAEISRLVLAHSKKDWTDNRIAQEDWPKIKPTTPTGGLPVLEVGGKMYGQGIAIATYLAKEAGLYGANNLEALAIDQIQMVREDLLTAEGKMMFEQDAAKKAEMTKKLSEVDYPKVLGFFNEALKANKNGFIVGKKLSVADIAVFVGTDGVAKSMPAVMGKFPEVAKLRTSVAGQPGIKEYLAKRKETPF